MTPNVITEGVKNIQQGQRADAEQAARSAVIENASAIIKQLSGAAVSTQEATRIEGFLPAPNDNARTIINKLKEAQRTARLRLDSYAIEYPSLQGQSYQNPPSATTQEPSGSSGKTPVGDPIVLKNKTYQKYTDGTVEEL